MMNRIASPCELIDMPNETNELSSPNPNDPRVAKLEEHAAYSERTIEQLSAEIAELNRRCRQLTQRLASLEERFGKLQDDGMQADG